MPPEQSLVTPEAVVLDFETAGVASRLLAGLLDVTVQLLATVAFFAAFAIIVQAGAELGGLAAALVYGFFFLILFGYPAAFETLWRGRTPGKAALGLRVVTAEGLPIRFRHAAIRAIFGLVDKYLFTGLVGVLLLLFTRRNQRLGDLVAGTIVLRERRGTRAPVAVAFHPPPGLEPLAATLDVAGLTHADYATVRSFLLRAATLTPAVRHQLAVQVATPLLARLRATAPPGVGPEAFLVCVAAAYQRRGRTVAAAPTSVSVWDTSPPAPTSGGAVEISDGQGSPSRQVAGPAGFHPPA